MNQNKNVGYTSVYSNFPLLFYEQKRRKKSRKSLLFFFLIFFAGADVLCWSQSLLIQIAQKKMSRCENCGSLYSFILFVCQSNRKTILHSNRFRSIQIHFNESEKKTKRNKKKRTKTEQRKTVGTMKLHKKVKLGEK